MRLGLALLWMGCAPPASVLPPVGVSSPVGTERRAFAPVHEGQPVIAGISYGPYRAGQRPGGPLPSRAEITEDLRLIAQDWNLLRVYGSGPPTDLVLEVIRDEALPLQVVVGAWISADDPEADEAEVASAIRLAQVFKDEVAAVSVGNETQVFWSAHRSDREALVRHLRRVRAAVSQPVTTADDYNFWNKPESQPVAEAVDFVLLHAYAMWNGKALQDAVPWTAQVVSDIQALHPTLPVVLGETGWATQLNPEGGEVEHIKAPAGEAEQRAFYRAFSSWAASVQQPYFYFSAFDEPWKGSADPREVEKHWGLYREDRTPKPALADGQP